MNEQGKLVITIQGVDYVFSLSRAATAPRPMLSQLAATTG